MSVDAPITEVELRSGLQAGSRLTLYANRVVHTAQDAFEIVPLSQMAAVGAAFQRDVRKLNWAIVLVVLGLILLALSGPMQSWMNALAAKVTTGPSGESLESVLVVSFKAIAALARLFVPVGLLMLAGAAALAFFFWLGQTILTLSAGGLDRTFPARGRNLQLMDFAQAVGEQLAARKT